MGQFLSQDTVYLAIGSGQDKREQVALLDPQMQNSYEYARNNPVKHTDPDGEFAFVIPLIAYGIWQAVEASLTVMDTVNAVQTLQSSYTTTTEKAISVVGAAAGIALPGGGYGKALNKVGDVASSVTKGKIGEAVSGIVKNTDRIPSVTGTAKYRIPDALDSSTKTIGEVKNVAQQSLTKQLQDFIGYAKQTKSHLTLFTRENTQLSKPLQNALESVKATVKKVLSK